VSRPDWRSYFLAIAREVATRSTCPRLSVGCVVELDRRILVTGYNGAPSGAPECLTHGCALVNGGCTRTVHAEANAIASAARHGVRLDGATAWITHSPCAACVMILHQAGVRQIAYETPYRLIAHLEELREVLRIGIERQTD